MENEYIESRLKGQMGYYKTKCASLQREYYILSSVNIVLLAFIPVITLSVESCPCSKYIIAGMSAIASVISSILLLRRTKDNWLEYRRTYEQLKTEKACYDASIGKYDNVGESERARILAESCENIMDKEHTQWKIRMEKEPISNKV